MVGGHFENQIFFGGGRNQNVLIFYSILSVFFKGFLKGNHPLIFPKNVGNLKTSLFRAFWVNFSTLFEKCHGFSMVSMELLTSEHETPF